MGSSIKGVIDTYIQAWSERDPLRRAALLEACFAADGRFVTRAGEVVGRVALDEMIASFHARQEFRRIMLTSAIDAGQTSFRFSGAFELPDGTTSVETFDTGEVDAAGRISLLFSFTGPLAPSPP